MFSELQRLIAQGVLGMEQYAHIVLPITAVVAVALVTQAVRAIRERRRMLPLPGGWVDTSNQHLLIVLIEAARADPAFRDDVLALLVLTRGNRRRVITTTLAHMKRDGVEARLVDAFGLLRDDVVVRRARELLSVGAESAVE